MRRFFIVVGLFIAFVPVTVLAITFTPSITIPGVATAGTPITITGSTFGEYIVAIYNTSVTVGAILATIVILVAGFVWLTAAGNVGQISTAKGIAGGAVSGVVLLLLSWVLLNTINPNLVNFKTIDIKPILREDLLSGSKGSCEFLSDAELPALQNEGSLTGSTWVLGAAGECEQGEDPNNAGKKCYCLQRNASGQCGGQPGRLCGTGFTCNRGFDCASGTELPRGDSGEAIDTRSTVGCCMVPLSNGQQCATGFNCASRYCDNGENSGSPYSAVGLCADRP